ncbi:UNVERIFIED_CONTAM: hypothetical protein Sradi_4926700 [Sesamum radiatum]|uniref:Secreted protein n=1 Tax=Sesamum radiatum TaxID=300843 RepID=A0AAW2MD19_SESRA
MGKSPKILWPCLLGLGCELWATELEWKFGRLWVEEWRLEFCLHEIEGGGAQSYAPREHCLIDLRNRL